MALLFTEWGEIQSGIKKTTNGWKVSQGGVGHNVEDPNCSAEEFLIEDALNYFVLCSKIVDNVF